MKPFTRKKTRICVGQFKRRLLSFAKKINSPYFTKEELLKRLRDRLG